MGRRKQHIQEQNKQNKGQKNNREKPIKLKSCSLKRSKNLIYQEQRGLKSIKLEMKKEKLQWILQKYKES